MKKIAMLLAATVLGACVATDPSQSQHGAPSALQGSWRLTEVAAVAVPMVGGGAKLLQFHEQDNKFSGNVGCNRLFGLYEKTGNQLRFSAMASSKMACDPMSMQLEQNVMNHMENVQYWQVQGNELRLQDGSQNTVLKFQKM